MSIEIERKFLVNEKFKAEGAGEYIAQGYLNRAPERTVRVRIKGKRGYLTIKGKNAGIKRNEYEYEIPLEDAQELLKMSEPSIIVKRRYNVKFGRSNWEVDVFEGDNAGLIIAEIELATETEEFDRPEWIGAEVSSEEKYYNSKLSKKPYNQW